MSRSEVTAGFGVSSLADPVAAGREAATAAVDALGGSPAGLVLVYSSVRYDLPALIAAIRGVTGDVPLAGASSCGSFQGGSLTPPEEGVSVLAVTSGPYRFGVASCGGVRADAFEVGRRLARAARRAAGPDPGAHAAVLLLVDGLAGNHQMLLNGVHRVAGAAVPVIGGAAADDRRLATTWVFHHDRVLTDAAVAVWIGAPAPIAVGCGHGWRPLGLPMLVTQSHGVVVETIDGRPAVEVFREHVRADQQGMEGVRPGGWQSAHAFGLIEPDGSQLIRGAFVLGDELRTFDPLPPYAAVQIVSAGPDELLDVTDEVIGTLRRGPACGVVLAFSCVARLDILADRGPEEAARIQAAAGDVPTFGFYTYGEYARTAGVAGYHNATFAAMGL